MLGLLGTLNLGARSLQVQRQGIEVAGHNIANANNPAYARQRLAVQTAEALQARGGLQGSGVDSTAILRLRNQFLDAQIQSETSVRGYLEAQQTALQYAQAHLGHTIDRQGNTTALDGAGQQGIGEGLAGLFNSFQSLSTQPASLAERQVLLMKAADLAVRFNQTDQRLESLQNTLNGSLEAGATTANELMLQIARLNERISNAEMAAGGPANDLRDLRQHRIEELSRLTKIDLAGGPNGTVNLSIGGVLMVDGQEMVDRLETYDAGGGRILLRGESGGAPFSLTGGSLAGTIDIRDNEITHLRENLNTLAATLITEVNELHRDGFNLRGGTGADFFSGTGAADFRVNPALMNDPAALQISGESGAAGDNQVALALAQLAARPQAALNGQTFVQSYGQSVAALGQSLSSANLQLADQKAVEQMLAQQRAAVSGVSLDEEMTDLMKFQKAFEASARLIAVVDELFDTVISMKR